MCTLSLLILTGVLVFDRPGADGPLDGGYPSGVVVEAFPAGSEVTYGLLVLDNLSENADLELVTVTPVLGDPAVEILGEALLLGLERVEQLNAGMFDVLPGWPPEGTTPVPVRGTIVEPGVESQFEVIVPVRVPSLDEPIGRIDGFVVEYRANGRRYRETFDTVLVLCPVEDNSRCREFAETL